MKKITIMILVVLMVLPVFSQGNKVQASSPADMELFIHAIPKAELHMHLEGSLEPEMKFMLAERNNVELKFNTVQEIKDSYNFNDLVSFLNVYYEGMSVLLTEQDFYDLTYAYLKKAREQNVLYTEMYFDPQAHTARGVSFDDVINGIHKAQVDAQANLGIRSALVCCFLRDADLNFSMATLNDAIRYKDWIIAVNLDSNEFNNPPTKYKHILDRARAEGFKVSVHCDTDLPQAVEHITEAVQIIEVDRLDHSVNALDKPSLLQEIKDKKLGMAICPLSNSLVAKETKAPEIKEILENDMLVSVHSDDPAYFGGYLEDNLLAIQKEAGFSKSQIAQLCINAFETSYGLTRAEKDWYIDLVKSYM